MNEIQKIMIERIEKEILVIQNNTRIKDFPNMLEQITDYYPKGQEKLALAGLKEIVLDLLDNLIIEVVTVKEGSYMSITNKRYRVSVGYIAPGLVTLRSYLITRLSTSITELSYKNREEV